MDESAGPEVKMFQDEIWKKLFEALDELPEKQRLVYVENELNDKTLQEIADEQEKILKPLSVGKTML
jgi:DNA-directed RNA polymerase specialized sigma24 family protein